MRLLLPLALLSSVACADTLPPDPNGFGPEIQLMGAWDNARQFAAAPAAARVPPRVGAIWLDRQYARQFVVSAPRVGDRVLYLEWRSGGPDGPISRQRIWRFRFTPDGDRTDFYTIAVPERFAGRGDVPVAFRDLTLADLTGYGDACAVRWRRVGAPSEAAWQGRIAPADCLITARSGRRMRLDVTMEVRPGRGEFSYHERGVLEDGALAFDVPSFAPYRFKRAR